MTSLRGLNFSYSEAQLEPAFRGLRLAFNSENIPAFRGLRLAFNASSEPSFRGARLAFALPGSPAFRGLKLAYKTVTGPELRGLRFAFANESEGPGLRGLKFFFDPPDTEDAPFNTNAFAAIEQNAPFAVNANAAVLRNASFNSTGFAAVVTNTSFNANAFSAVVRSSQFSVDANAAVQRDSQFNSSAYIIAQRDSTFNASAFVVTQQEITFDSIAFAIADETSLLKTRETNTGFNNVILGANPFVPVQGNSAGAIAPDGSTLFAWVQPNGSGQGMLIGRVDSPNDKTNIGAAILSPTINIEGVKVCYMPNTDEWAIVWKIGTDIQIAIYSKDLSAVRMSDTTITNQTPAVVTPDHFDIGTADNGFLSVFYYNTTLVSGEIMTLDVTGVAPLAVTFPVATASATSANKMTVHKTSGNISIIYPDATDVKVDRYVMSAGIPVGPPTTFTVATGQSGLDPLYMDILSREGNEGWVACWSNDSVGDNILYRLFEGASLSFDLAPITIAGTGHVDAIGKAFFAEISPVPTTADVYEFVIKVVDTAPATNKTTFAWTKIQSNPGNIETNGTTPETQLVFPPGDRSVPTPIVAISEYEYAHIYKSGNEIAREFFVNSSVYMGLWRIDRNASMFANTVAGEDADAIGIMQSIYGVQLNGTLGTDNSDYLSSRSKDPSTAISFNDFLNPTIDEDTVFVGGPIVSEVANSIHTNTNIYQAQLSTLNSEIDISDASFVNPAPPVDGFATGAAAPAVKIVNSFGTFNQTRRVVGPDIVDYAIILRLAVTTKSTQTTKAAMYIAGINRIGTKAAAYCLQNPVEFRVGQSSGCLVVLKYPAPPGFNPATDIYIPGTTGTIKVIPLSDVDADDIT